MWWEGLHSVPEITRGSIVVTYIQIKARNMVFPMAIFRSALNGDKGIFGAEYRKVATIAGMSQGQ